MSTGSGEQGSQTGCSPIASTRTTLRRAWDGSHHPATAVAASSPSAPKQSNHSGMATSRCVRLMLRRACDGSLASRSRGRSSRGAMRRAGCWQGVEHGLGQTFAGVPHLERDYLVGSGVVVDQSPADLFTENIVRVAGGQPSDVGIAVVIGVAGTHRFEDSWGGHCSLGPFLSSQRPRADDSRSVGVAFDGVVIDDGERLAIAANRASTLARPCDGSPALHHFGLQHHSVAQAALT
jgi:hypothetical protein